MPAYHSEHISRESFVALAARVDRLVKSGRALNEPLCAAERVVIKKSQEVSL